MSARLEYSKTPPDAASRASALDLRVRSPCGGNPAPGQEQVACLQAVRGCARALERPQPVWIELMGALNSNS
jgi:glycine/D-amino acid oxidase-like deaminating enzyme